MKRSWLGGLCATTKRLSQAALLVAVLPGTGRAEEPKPVRVGASHRVDVIAPGERIQTAIDRMRRTSLPTRETAPRPVQRLAPRPPSERAASERGTADRAASDRAAERAAERGSDRAGAVEEPKQGALPPPVAQTPARR